MYVASLKFFVDGLEIIDDEAKMSLTCRWTCRHWGKFVSASHV
jgi:hypothetical protein